MTLPDEIYSVATVRELDRLTIEEGGISGYALMTRAAQSAFDIARAAYPDAKRWQIICGAGNNAGDGYVLARIAGEQGVAVSVVSLIDPTTLAGDAATSFADFFAVGGSCTTWEGELDPDADLLIEGLLGSGLCRQVEGEFADAIARINEHAAPVLALDIPGGIDGDTGRAMGAAVRADHTVTFVGLKKGLFLADASSAVGELHFSGLGIPDAIRARLQPDLRHINYSQLATALAPRARDSHKGDFGHLVIVGGGPGMPGAVALSGEAALRCGAGRVSIATHPDHSAAIAAARPELMCHGIEAPEDLGTLLKTATALVVGPGLGQGDWGKMMFEAAMRHTLPMVVDADGLTMLAASDVRHPEWILTPHPGEAARLLESTSADVQQDRVSAVRQIQKDYGGTAVLKGAGTLVASSQEAPSICTLGNPGMAVPGMGDVLSGVIGAFLAQAMGQTVAALAGVEVHARAGDSAAEKGERGILARDLMPHLRDWVNP